MTSYRELEKWWTDPALRETVADYLTEVWVADYGRALGRRATDLVVVSDHGFCYLFDVGRERLVAAWGFSKGKHHGVRDKARMAGHPHRDGKTYHRGHAIAHTLGGGTDINLVKQLGKINCGVFRVLEIEAVANPGAFYFTYWKYASATTQTPSEVEQGLLRPDGNITISPFGN